MVLIVTLTHQVLWFTMGSLSDEPGHNVLKGNWRISKLELD